MTKVVVKPLPHGVIPFEQIPDPNMKRAVMLNNENVKELKRQLAENQIATQELQRKPTYVPTESEEAAAQARAAAEAAQNSATSAASSATTASAASNSALGSANVAERARVEVAENAEIASTSAVSASENAEIARVSAETAASYSGQVFNLNYSDDTVEWVRFKVEGSEVGTDRYWGRFFVYTKSLAINTSHIFAVDLFLGSTEWEAAGEDVNEMFAHGFFRDNENPSDYGVVFIKTRPIATGTKLRAAIYAPNYGTEVTARFNLEILVPIRRKV